MRKTVFGVLSMMALVASGQTQDSTAPTKPPPAWSSIAIHVTDPAKPIDGYSREQANGINEHAMDLKDIISEGYNFSVMPFRDEEISGLPDWAKATRYEITAKVDDADVEAFKKLSDLSMKDTIAAFIARRPTGEMLMMQALLRDRFNLRVHWETKERSVFVLVVAKGGVRMKPAADPDHGEMMFSNGHLSGKGIPISFLASLLGKPVGHSVLDKTGLTASYDFDLHFDPHDPGADPSSDPDLFTAVQEQLGLKLQSTRAPMQVLFVDQVERPTPN